MAKFTNYTRRKTSTTYVGNLCIGSDYPIRIQSMANTSTNDIEASVAQTLRVAQAGADLFRFTTQGIKEVESLAEIRKTLPLYSSTPLLLRLGFIAELVLSAVHRQEVGILCN